MLPLAFTQAPSRGHGHSTMPFTATHVYTSSSHSAWGGATFLSCCLPLAARSIHDVVKMMHWGNSDNQLLVDERKSTTAVNVIRHYEFIDVSVYRFTQRDTDSSSVCPFLTCITALCVISLLFHTIFGLASPMRDPLQISVPFWPCVLHVRLCEACVLSHIDSTHTHGVMTIISRVL